MFWFKKTLTPFLLPPGIFVLLLAAAGARSVVKRRWALGMFHLLAALALWLLSILPVSDALLHVLESPFSTSEVPSGDVIIILGGGSRDDVPDLTGVGFPEGGTLGRMVTGLRLHRQLDVPIIVSAGRLRSDETPGATIAKRILIDLGVAADQVIAEDHSRDTYENALYSKELCQRHGFEHPIVVTSAYHMQRSLLTFQRVGLDAAPYPANFKTAAKRVYRWQDYLPRHDDLSDSARALRELMGSVFYRMVY